MRTVGQFEVRCGDKFSNTFWCDRMAVSPQKELYALSVMGPEIQVKALAAALQSHNITLSMGALDLRFEQGAKVVDLSRCGLYDPGEGWRCYRFKLPQRQGQLIAVSQAPGLLLDMSQESLWRELTSERYTTPLLKSWLPKLTEWLQTKGKLTPLATFNCNAGLLSIEPDDLDALVSELVRHGTLVIN